MLKKKQKGGSNAARQLQAMRKHRRGGRPKVMHPCPYCRLQFSATDIRKHLTECPERAKLAAS